MVRTAGMVGFPSGQNFPPEGTYLCECIKVEKSKSKVKGTPALNLEWLTTDHCYCFSDAVYVTPKTISRLNLIAQRVCGMPETFELPDDDLECAKALANVIYDSVVNKTAMVTIETNEEEYMVTEGEDMGKKKVVSKSRVAFNGYGKPIETPVEKEPESSYTPDDEIPF